MSRPGLFLAALPALAAAISFVGAPPADPAGAGLMSAVTERRLSEAVQVFSGLARPTATDQYLTGFALMELPAPQEAAAHLRAAQEAGFQVWKGWPEVDALLDRVRTCGRLAPPHRALSIPEPAIAVYAGPPTAWSAPVLAAIPEFEAVGRRIFGKDLPPLRFYLFAERKEYDRFFEALFGVPVSTAWQDGTGTLNVVVYCETDRRGRTARAAGAPETLGCVLHEFGHAWFGTYLMHRHGKEWLSPAMRRPWLDEGLADFVASLRDPAFLESRAAWLKEKAAGGAPAPAFEEIGDYDSFYRKGDVDVHYWASALLVADLLGPLDRAP